MPRRLAGDAPRSIGLKFSDIWTPLALHLVVLGAQPSRSSCDRRANDAVPLDSDYPFWLGTATSAYQIEGAWNVSGRGPSIWDTFTHEGKAYNNETGDVAVDFFHRYEEDIALMQQLGIRNFRLSISWTRIMPTGRPPVNPEGIDFYRRVLTALQQACITPHITLYHWDLPQPLYDEYLGWISPDSQDDFAEYARTVFEELGSFAEHWTTFNEPWTFCYHGYGTGVHAPGRCTNCTEGGDSVTEPLLCAYNVALAHAKAATHFRTIKPNGRLSANLNCDWVVPLTPGAADAAAAIRLLDYNLHAYGDPLFWGTMPEWLYDAVPSLPRFTEEERALLLANRPDFFALNHYSTNYVFEEPAEEPTRANVTKVGLDGNLNGPMADSAWLTVAPWGIRSMINHVYSRYSPAYILITENGVDVPGEGPMSAAEAVEDTFRQDFYLQYLDNVTAAVMEDGVPVKGYFAWSLVDNFEWGDGYNKRFGIVYVDYANNLTRTPKHSALMLSEGFGLQKNAVVQAD